MDQCPSWFTALQYGAGETEIIAQVTAVGAEKIRGDVSIEDLPAGCAKGSFDARQRIPALIAKIATLAKRFLAQLARRRVNDIK
jgi:hypothetical protein